MNLRIFPIHWNDINKSKLVNFIYSVRIQENLQLNITKNDLYKFLQKYSIIGSSIFILATISKEIVGCIFLYQTNTDNFIINTDNILGGTPIVKDHKSYITIVKELLLQARNYAIDCNFKNIEFEMNWNPKLGQNLYQELINLYRDCGFHIKLKYVEMSCNLQKYKIPIVKEFEGIMISQIKSFDTDVLYQCYHNAFINGDAKFFMYQTEQERREYFDDLLIPHFLNEKASIAMLHNDQIVGFSYILKLQKNNDHISCMCIKPSYQGKGLGKFLLFKIMEILKHQGSKKVTLGTETEMRAYNLYKKYGFDINNGFIDFRWNKSD